MTRPTRKTLFASLLILLWAAAMLAAYWWYEARYLRSFSEQTALFYGEQLRLPDELAWPGPIRLVHDLGFRPPPSLDREPVTRRRRVAVGVRGRRIQHAPLRVERQADVAWIVADRKRNGRHARASAHRR